MEPLVAPPTAPAAPLLPSLPVELVQRIIKLALPRVCFTTFRERYDTLLPLCLVNKTWGALAEQELYRHLGLASKNASGPMMPLSATPLGLTQLAGVRSIWDNHSGISLDEIVQACPRLTTLLTTTTSSPATKIDIRLVASVAPNLNKLVLDYCSPTLDHSNRPLAFPNLRRLTLSWFNAGSCGVGALLSVIDAPQLDTLMIILGDEGDDDEYEDFVQSIGRLAPQLKRFGFLSYFGDPMPAAAWSHFTSLNTLTLGTGNHLRSIFAALPSPLRALRICPRPHRNFYFHDLLEALRPSPATLDSLKQLRIPLLGPMNYLDVNDGHGAKAARAGVLELCASKAIEVFDGKIMPQRDTYVAYLEEVLDL